MMTSKKSSVIIIFLISIAGISSCFVPQSKEHHLLVPPLLSAPQSFENGGTATNHKRESSFDSSKRKEIVVVEREDVQSPLLSSPFSSSPNRCKTPPASITNPHDDHDDSTRRSLWEKVVMMISMVGMIEVGLASPKKVMAIGNSKSRTEGYSVQKSTSEWRSILSSAQFDVLRNGGTERPYSSILETEERHGIYSCAGCNTPLFDAKDKFHSGTGWPSFANALSPGVEIEKVNALQSNLAGAELRCRTCGGHLGDVFNDGFLFVGTPAFQSGKRFCIDGAALVFTPSNGETVVVGDTPPPPKKGAGAVAKVADWFEPPKITPKTREEI